MSASATQILHRTRRPRSQTVSCPQLGHLVKLQEDLRLQQTLKLMETTLIDVIKTLPAEVKEEFFSEYETRAKKAGLT